MSVSVTSPDLNLIWPCILELFPFLCIWSILWNNIIKKNTTQNLILQNENLILILWNWNKTRLCETQTLLKLKQNQIMESNSGAYASIDARNFGCDVSLPPLAQTEFKGGRGRLCKGGESSLCLSWQEVLASLKATYSCKNQEKIFFHYFCLPFN